MLNISGRNKYLAFVILIGGKSTRFGTDKGLYEFLGKPLITYQLEVLSQFNHDIYVAAHSKNQVQKYINTIDYRNITAFIIDDSEYIRGKNLRTPLIGIYSAFRELNKLGYKKAFTLSCDLPLVKFETINFLITQANNVDCCVPRWNNNYIEPLFAIYPVAKALQKIKENLTNQTYKLLQILDKNWNIKYISIENEIQPLDEKLHTFININNHVDIEKLLEIYHK
ncbi:MAG: molybdenum cofactor guanylyltransferase [Promethearchaeota archaeon]